MTNAVYYEKARELGELILDSEKAEALSKAREVFNNDIEAQKKLEEYSLYQMDIQKSVSENAMTQEEFDTATKRLTEMGSELKKDSVVGALITAENEFGGFVNQIMNVLKATITGESECDSGGCSGCSGGCSH